MLEQASKAVMAAYADGASRQSVTLNLEVVSPPQRRTEAGMPAVLQDTLPLMKAFTQRLGMPGGAAMKEVRVSAIDQLGTSSGDVGTLFYRISEAAEQDVAVVFLGSRIWAVEDGSRKFLDGMKSRLVVVANSEDAACSFRIENQGKEFIIGGNFGQDMKKLEYFCAVFQEETYYYRSKVINDWAGVLFRSYPHPWEVFIQNMEGEVESIGTSQEKPTMDTMKEWVRAYEEANGITVADKLAAARATR